MGTFHQKSPPPLRVLPDKIFPPGGIFTEDPGLTPAIVKYYITKLLKLRGLIPEGASVSINGLHQKSIRMDNGSWECVFTIDVTPSREVLFTIDNPTFDTDAFVTLTAQPFCSNGMAYYPRTMWCAMIHLE